MHHRPQNPLTLCRLALYHFWTMRLPRGILLVFFRIARLPSDPQQGGRRLCGQIMKLISTF